MDYLDDFLGDFEVDKEFTTFSPSTTKKSQKLTDDWSIPVGEFEDEIHSSGEHELDSDKPSNFVEEPAQSKNTQANAFDDADNEQPVIRSASNKSWSGVIYDSNKLTSVIDTIKVDPKKGPKIQSSSGGYLPKAPVFAQSTAKPSTEAYFPALGEKTEEIQPQKEKTNVDIIPSKNPEYSKPNNYSNAIKSMSQSSSTNSYTVNSNARKILENLKLNTNSIPAESTNIPPSKTQNIPNEAKDSGYKSKFNFEKLNITPNPTATSYNTKQSYSAPAAQANVSASQPKNLSNEAKESGYKPKFTLKPNIDNLPTAATNGSKQFSSTKPVQKSEYKINVSPVKYAAPKMAENKTYSPYVPKTFR